MEKVSIIMPAYKAKKTIEKTIQSVEKQTYSNIELIIVENGPKDSVEEIINKFKENNLEIKYLYCEKPNVSNARNIGIENATGKYIAFIDADDEYESDFLYKMVSRLEVNNADLVSCGYKTSDNKIQRLIESHEDIKCSTDLQKYLEKLKKNFLFNELWNKVYVNEIIKSNNILFDETYELGEDYLFNLEYLKNIKKACYLNEVLYVYTVSDTGLKLKYRKDKFDIEYDLTKKLKEYYQEMGYSMEFVNNQFARIYYNGIIDIFKDNNPLSKKEKNNELKDFIIKENYKSDLDFLKNNVTDKKFKLAIKHFFLKGQRRIKIFVLLNNLFHRR